MNTLDSLFSWFAAATVRGSLLALAVLAVQAALRGRMPARWRYLLWLPVVMVLVAPGLPESRWSLENLVPRDSPRILRVAAPAAASVDHIQRPVSQAPASPTPSPRWDWRVIAALAWLTGSAGVLCFSMTAYARTMRRIRLGEVPVTAAVAALLVEATAASGTARTVRVLASHAVESPAVTGILRPVLLLPAGFPGAFTQDEVRLVLLHEMAHLKRYDLPVNWLVCLLQAIHWCNPVLWFAFARMRADREAACDEDVLAATAHDCRADYGHALLKLESSLSGSGLNLGFLGIFEGSTGVQARMRAIARYRRAHPAWAALSVALIIALSAGGATRAQNAAPSVPSNATVGNSSGKSPGSEDGSKRQQVPTVQNADDQSRQRILRKLETIIIPRIAFRDASLPEALDFLTRKSVELDTGESDPAKRGVNLVLRLESAPGQPGIQSVPRIPGLEAVPGAVGAVDPKEARLTVSLRDVPLGEALHYVATLAGLKYKVEPYAISLTSLGSPEPLVTREWKLNESPATVLGEKTERDPKAVFIANGINFSPESWVKWIPLSHRLVMKNTESNIDLLDALLTPVAIMQSGEAPTIPIAEAQRKALSIVIPKLELREVEVADAIEFVRKKAVALDPMSTGVNIVVALDGNKAADGARITVSLKNIPVWEALRYITSLANLKLTAEPNGLRIQPDSSIDDTAVPIK